MDFDAIVIGSGFGGAVVAARLAEANYRVLVLERGRRWEVRDYPRQPEDAWIWDDAQPERRNGWFDLRVFPQMSVVQGAGVGGGSLVYANISIDAKKDTFESGWPPEVTLAELRQPYSKVGAMLDVRPVPRGQWPVRTHLIHEAAGRNGWENRFQPLDLAVQFDDTWHYGLEDPHHERHSRPVVNAQGQQQGTCVHLGNCDIGCEVKAKNTLDLNYLPLAERHHAEVRALHVVRSIAEESGGYRVHFERIDQDGRTLVPGSATARLVFLSAGSLGSTELLLRSRDVTGTLPRVSAALGRGWSSNGDFLTPAIHRRRVEPTRGPTITAAIDFLDGDGRGAEFFIEDGGFPDLAKPLMQEWATRLGLDERERALVMTARLLALSQFNALDHVMPWFAQGRDAADGTLSLKSGRLFLDWKSEASEHVINAIVRTHEALARSTEGLALVPLTWTWARALITPHPLGGARMGRTAADGVVDHKGEVFGHRNLFVADGAIVPTAIGLNPSKTIAALAERIAALVVQDGR